MAEHICLDLESTLFIRPNGAYSTDMEGAMALPSGHFQLEDVNVTLTQRQRNVNLGKGRLGKERKEQVTLITP